MNYNMAKVSPVCVQTILHYIPLRNSQRYKLCKKQLCKKLHTTFAYSGFGPKLPLDERGARTAVNLIFISNLVCCITIWKLALCGCLCLKRRRSIFVLFPCSGRCEWGIRRCCQLSVVTHQLQTLRQLQVTHSEERRLQPHAVCQGALFSFCSNVQAINIQL